MKPVCLAICWQHRGMCMNILVLMRPTTFTKRWQVWLYGFRWSRGLWKDLSIATSDCLDSMKWNAWWLWSSSVLPMSLGALHPGITFEVRYVSGILAEEVSGREYCCRCAFLLVSPQKGVCRGTCPFETTTFPAQAWRRLFGARKRRNIRPRICSENVETSTFWWHEGGGGSLFKKSSNKGNIYHSTIIYG